MFIFSTPVLIRPLWQLKTVVFLHGCLICAVLLYATVEHCCNFSLNLKWTPPSPIISQWDILKTFTKGLKKWQGRILPSSIPCLLYSVEFNKALAPPNSKLHKIKFYNLEHWKMCWRQQKRGSRLLNSEKNKQSCSTLKFRSG